MRAPDPYAVDALFYDAVHGEGGEDLPFWAAFAREGGGPILEVGAGTGRLTLPLAREGHALTALDPSPAMLAIARAKAAAAGLAVAFVEGRLPGAMPPREAFAAVLFPADVFLACADAAEQVAALRAAADALAPGGRVALDLPGPGHWLEPAGGGEPLLAFAGDVDGDALLVWHVREDDLAAQTRDLRVIYERSGADGIVRRAVARHRLRYVTRPELDLLLDAAGLCALHVRGAYGPGPLTNGSERMNVIAERAGEGRATA